MNWKLRWYAWPDEPFFPACDRRGTGPDPSRTGQGAEVCLVNIEDVLMRLFRRELVAALAHDRMEEALERIFTKYEDYKARHDLVVIEGTHEGVSFTLPCTLQMTSS